MRVRFRHTLPLALVLSLADCIRVGRPLGEPNSGVPGEGTTISNPKSRPTPTRGVWRKRVAAKHDPNLLLAEDGTSCAVSAERYRDVKVGDHVVCVWQ